MRTLILGLLVWSVLGLARPAEATLVRAFPMRALTVHAHEIVRGHVLGSEVVYDPVFERVYTHTQVRVLESLAGETRAGAVIMVRQIGGLLDGVESRVVGTAPLMMGTEVILFTRTDSAHHYLVGMAQGAYTVDRRSPGEITLHRGGGGLRMAPIHGPSERVAPGRLTLNALRDTVRSYRSGEVAP